MKRSFMTKALSSALVATMVLSMTACGGNNTTGSTTDNQVGTTESATAGDQTEISMYTTIPGHDEEFEAMCEEFMAKNPDIKVDYIAYDSSEKQKWMTLYAGGEAPTVSIMDAVDIRENAENMLAFDASDAALQGIDSTYTDIFTIDGSVYGVPNSVQAMGIIYNKTVIETATGEAFDPASIKCTSDLAALCEKIQAGGVAPLMLTGVDWSLGSHFLSQVFSGIRGDADAQIAFVDEVKSGNVDLKTDPAWNSIMDTFDLFAQYNYNSKDPLVGNTDIDGQAMADGQVAMWFMGDWGWTYLKDIVNGTDEFGIMPCPLNDDAADPINQQLGVFPAKGYCIDKSQNSEAEQEAGKRLIEFLTVDDAQAMADLLGTALPSANVDVTYTSPLVESVQSYISSGSTASTYAFSSLLPSDFWSENGAVMQQYLVGQCTRDQAADAIQAYWQSQN